MSVKCWMKFGIAFFSIPFSLQNVINDGNSISTIYSQQTHSLSESYYLDADIQNVGRFLFNHILYTVRKGTHVAPRAHVPMLVQYLAFADHDAFSVVVTQLPSNNHCSMLDVLRHRHVQLFQQAREKPEDIVDLHDLDPTLLRDVLVLASIPSKELLDRRWIAWCIGGHNNMYLRVAADGADRILR